MTNERRTHIYTFQDLCLHGLRSFKSSTLVWRSVDYWTQDPCLHIPGLVSIWTRRSVYTDFDLSRQQVLSALMRTVERTPVPLIFKHLCLHEWRLLNGGLTSTPMRTIERSTHVFNLQALLSTRMIICVCGDAMQAPQQMPAFKFGQTSGWHLLALPRSASRGSSEIQS